jgi:lysophospholipase L1-like esterase
MSLRPRPLSALLLALAFALAACTGDEAALPQPTPTPDEGSEVSDLREGAVTDPAEGAPLDRAADDTARQRPAPDPEAEQLTAGVTDAAEVPGEPLLIGLGDSIAAGTGLERPRDGFVWRVHGALAEEGVEGLANLAVPGATTRSLREGGQLDRAAGLLGTAEVAAVVVSIGGNDLLGLFRGACGQGLGTQECAAAIDDAVVGFAERLDGALADLVAAGPEVPIVWLSLYNPFDLGTGSQWEVRAAEAVAALNVAGAEVAAEHGVAVAAGFEAIEGQVGTATGMTASQPDVHPTARGHDRLAVAVLDALAR